MTRESMGVAIDSIVSISIRISISTSSASYNNRYRVECTNTCGVSSTIVDDRLVAGAANNGRSNHMRYLVSNGNWVGNSSSRVANRGKGVTNSGSWIAKSGKWVGNCGSWMNSSGN